MTRRTCGCLVLGWLTAVPLLAQTAVPLTAAFQISTGVVALNNGTAVAALPGDAFAVAWARFDVSSAGTAIVNRVGVEGQLLGDEVETHSFSVTDVALAARASGDFMAACPTTSCTRPRWRIPPRSLARGRSA